MNASELAQKMLEAEKLHSQLVELESQIAKAVYELKESQKVGNVKATYTSGRRELDWETPAKLAPKEVIEEFTEVKESVDYQKACEIANVDPDIIAECTSYFRYTDAAAVCKKLKFEPVVLKEGTPTVKISYS